MGLGSSCPKCPESEEEKEVYKLNQEMQKKLDNAINVQIQKNARILNDALRLKGQAPIYQNEYDKTPPTTSLRTISDTFMGQRFGGSRRTRRSRRPRHKSRKNRSRK